MPHLKVILVSTALLALAGCVVAPEPYYSGPAYAPSYSYYPDYYGPSYGGGYVGLYYGPGGHWGDGDHGHR
jgi:hypothetical protein